MSEPIGVRAGLQSVWDFSAHWIKSNWAPASVSLLIIACFMPYVSILGVGVRPEQILVYGLLILIVPFNLRVLVLNRSALIVLGAFGLQLATSVLGGLFFDRSPDLTPVGFLAGIDTFLMPIATILTVAFLGYPLIQLSPLLKVAGRVLVVMLSINALVALLLQPRWKLDSPLKVFWIWPTEAWSTAEQAQLALRYSGIFNQPAEAGFAYGLGLVVLAFVCRWSRLWTIVSATILLLGGVLSASKTFYACALVVGIWVLWSGIRERRPLIAASEVLIPSLVTFATMLTLGLVPSRLALLDFVSRIVAANRSGTDALSSSKAVGAETLQTGTSPEGVSSIEIVVDQLTGHRISSTSFSASVAEQVFSLSPVVGFGIGGWQVAYDSAWIEALVLAGTVGLALSALIFLVLVARALNQMRHWPHSTLLLVLTVCAIITSLGIGTFTANRVSTFFWILVTLAAFGSSRAQGPVGITIHRPPS